MFRNRSGNQKKNRENTEEKGSSSSSSWDDGLSTDEINRGNDKSKPSLVQTQIVDKCIIYILNFFIFISAFPLL